MKYLKLSLAGLALAAAFALAAAHVIPVHADEIHPHPQFGAGFGPACWPDWRCQDVAPAIGPDVVLFGQAQPVIPVQIIPQAIPRNVTVVISGPPPASTPPPPLQTPAATSTPAPMPPPPAPTPAPTVTPLPPPAPPPAPTAIPTPTVQAPQYQGPASQAGPSPDPCLAQIDRLESGGSYTAENQSSGAYGRYQFLPHGGVYDDYAAAHGTSSYATPIWTLTPAEQDDVYEWAISTPGIGYSPWSEC